MKRIICILLIFLNMSLISAEALSGNLRLETDKEKIANNEEFTLIFYVDCVEDAYGMEVYIHYDDTFLMPLQKTLNLNEESFKRDVFIVKNRVANGEIELVGTLLGEGEKNKTSKIFYVPFKALKKGKTMIKIDTLKVLNEYGEKLKVNIVNKEIVIHEKIEKHEKHNHTKHIIKGYVNSKDNNVDNIKTKSIYIHNTEKYEHLEKYIESLLILLIDTKDIPLWALDGNSLKLMILKTYLTNKHILTKHIVIES